MAGLDLDHLIQQRPLAGLVEAGQASVGDLAQRGRRQEAVHLAAHRLFGGPAEDALGRRVPVIDAGLAVDADDGLGRRRQQRLGARLLGLARHAGSQLALLLHDHGDQQGQHRQAQQVEEQRGQVGGHVARHARRADQLQADGDQAGDQDGRMHEQRRKAQRGPDQQRQRQEADHLHRQRGVARVPPGQRGADQAGGDVERLGAGHPQRDRPVALGPRQQRAGAGVEPQAPGDQRRQADPQAEQVADRRLHPVRQPALLGAQPGLRPAAVADGGEAGVDGGVERGDRHQERAVAHRAQRQVEPEPARQPLQGEGGQQHAARLDQRIAVAAGTAEVDRDVVVGDVERHAQEAARAVEQGGGAGDRGGRPDRREVAVAHEGETDLRRQPEQRGQHRHAQQVEPGQGQRGSEPGHQSAAGRKTDSRVCTRASSLCSSMRPPSASVSMRAE